MFRRRVFYNAAGEVVRCYAMQGELNPYYTVEQEKNDFNITGCDCLEWTEPDPATEAAFAEVDADGKARTVSVTVDLSGSEPQLSFTYAPVEDPTERDDPYTIIDILTGEG